MELINNHPERMNLSFSGCGFLCVYHAGVAAAIKEYAPELLQNKILGASAGSIVACGLITNVCISHATSTMLKVVSQARSRTFGPLHPEFNLLGIVREELERILPPNAYVMCTGRLMISLTRWSDHENFVVQEFSSNEDLIDAIMCSCFIPLYCGLTPPTYRGVQYIDGGISDNQPIFDSHTVTVSPFSGESDICPPDWDSGSMFGVDFNGTSIRFTARNMFRLMACLWPRSTEDLSKMCLQGFGDALRFLTKHGMAPCIRCLTIQTIETKMKAERMSTGSFSESDDPKKALAPVPVITGPNRLRARNSSSALNSFRTRGESECETCGDSDMLVEEANVHNFFPSIMRKPFEETFAAERSVFGYIMTFRLVRYATTLMGISKFPLDMALAFAKKVHQYLDMMSPPRWILRKFRALADFIYGEVEKQKSRYTKFSCLVAVEEVDRYGSSLAHSTMEKDDIKEIELSEEAKQELRLLRERDRRRKTLKKAGKITPNNSESSLPEETYDVDSLEHVIDFTRNHETLYEFHYMDENKVVHTCELFTSDHKKHPHVPAHHNSALGCTPSRLVHVPEEDEDAVSISATGPVRFIGGEVIETDDKDSGLSGVEMRRDEQEKEPSTSKRDACCSPVRDFENKTPVESSPRRNEKGRSSQRRYAVENIARKAKKSPSVVASVPQMSSDSEGVDGTEKLFVPSRKAWRASSDFDNTDFDRKDSTANHSDTTTA